MRPLRTAAILVAASVVLACGGGGASSTGPTSRGTVDHVDMSQPTATINVGQTVTLKATGRAADGTAVADGVQWSSAAASIASVTQFGVVTGVAPGVADIMATIGGKTGHTAVTVVAQGTAATGDYTDIAVAPTTWTTCGRTDVGKVRCWGMNPVGQIGDGTTTDRATPTLVSTTQSFAQVAISDSQSCGRTAAGDLYCWGSLGFGPGSTERPFTPVPFSTGLSFADVSLGYEDACARTVAGQAYCWGRNLYGVAGDGSKTERIAPVAVTGGLTFAQVTVGQDFACGRTASGAVYCWGHNDLGELGDGTTTDRLAPTHVSGNVLFSAISAGFSDVCGLSTAGAIYCWGTTFGVVPGTGGASPVPTAVTSSQTFAQIATGVFHACALTATGAAWCWGSNDHRELGDGSITSTRTSPVAVIGGIAFSKIAVGHWYTCGVSKFGAAYCWGLNDRGNLGNGTLASSAEPTLVK